MIDHHPSEPIMMARSTGDIDLATSTWRHRLGDMRDLQTQRAAGNAGRSYNVTPMSAGDRRQGRPCAWRSPKRFDR
jgi:hypothetical protein